MALGGDQSEELMIVLKFSTAVEMTSPMATGGGVETNCRVMLSQWNPLLATY